MSTDVSILDKYVEAGDLICVASVRKANTDGVFAHTLFLPPNGLVLQLPGPGLRVHPKATECDAQTVPRWCRAPDGARSAASTC